jgi:hypothetical protein
MYIHKNISKMDKVYILTYAHKRPDFIKIQYQSIVENVKDNFEYIVFNNSVDDPRNREEISSICNELKIRCIDIPLDRDLEHHGGELNFNNNGYINPNLACSYPLVWTFKKYLSKEEYVCIIDSDMFFLSDISLIEKVRNIDSVYIPQWRNFGHIHYMWNAFVLLNLKRNPNLKNLDWHPGSIDGHSLDVGGQTHHFIKDHELLSQYLTEFSIREIKDINENEKEIHYIQDGSVNYSIGIKDEKLKSFKQTNGHLLNFSAKRSFPHEEERNDFSSHIAKKCFAMLEILKNSGSELPKPEHIAFIGDPEDEDFIILHYKSGSNYLDFTTDDYNLRKTSGAIKIIDYLRNKKNNL